MKTCKLCGIPRSESEFEDKPRNKDGLSGTCFVCIKRQKKDCYARYYKKNHTLVLVRQKEWRDSNKNKILAKERRYTKTAHGKSVKREAARKYREENALKARARSEVSNAISSGKLAHDRCEICGSESRLEFHHHKGYEPENWLDVICLCVPCHTEADNEVV